MNHTVDISAMVVSKSGEDVLVTYALGSCLGLTIYDPEACVGGMIHCMLPLSKIDKVKAAAEPCKFVDTGLPRLFQEAYRLGAVKERIVVKAAGCAKILDDQGHFKIGERNHATMRKILWKNSILVESEDVGQSHSRTLYLEIGTGRVSIKAKGQTTEL
jgi:chemotaxis protein CheD